MFQINIKKQKIQGIFISTDLCYCYNDVYSTPLSAELIGLSEADTDVIVDDS